MATGDDTGVSGYTQCPSCLTIFKVSPTAFQGAHGKARCGLCGSVFDARARWRRDLPPPRGRSQRPLRVTAIGARQPDRGATDKKGARPAQRARRRAGDGAATAPARRDAAGAQRGQPAADPDHGPTPPPWRVVADSELEVSAVAGRRWPWGVALVALALVLALQLAWFHRESLADVPALYPWVAQACQHAPCAPEPPRQPATIEVVERVLRPHAERDGAMELTATISNEASIRQPWPQLGLRLSALNGAIIASHWFEPQRYLSTQASKDDYMEPNQEYAVRVVFRRPEREVAGFELDFR